jgi:hypothetical protein
MARLRSHLPAKYSPLLPDGRGLQSVYFTEVPGDLMQAIVHLIGEEAQILLLAVRHRTAAPEGLYFRAFSRFVTSSTVEYATRPTGRLPGLVFHQQEGQPLSAARSGYKGRKAI